MSETVTEPTVAPVEAPAADPAVAPVEVPVVAAEPAPEPEPTAAPKPDKGERRYANMTRKLADEARAREAAERRASAAEALLQASRPDSTQPGASASASDLEARAAALVAEREFNRRLSEIDSAGKKEVGTEAWERAKSTLTSLGATSNQAFLQALAEAENPAKLFAHFADDTDELMELLAKPPAAMAAKIGRIDANLSRPAPRPLSSAPVPPPRREASVVVPEPTPYTYSANMSMKEWSKMMDAHLPPHLGGKKRAS